MLARIIFKVCTVLLVLGVLAGLLVASGPALPGFAGAPGAPLQAGKEPAGALLAPSAETPPTTRETDDQGYITWSVDYSDVSWCSPVSTLRYPLDLGTQDPNELSNALVTLKYVQRNYILPPNSKDSSWSVSWNGSPPDVWQRVGDIKGLISASGEEILNSQAVTITNDLLQDGENNLWLEQHETCPSPGCQTCACTCVELTGLSLRAAPRFKVGSVSPEDGALNVPFDQSKDQAIRVKFTRPPDPKSLTKETLEVRYYDPNLNPVLVAGSIEKITKVEYAFVPDAPLMDGVQYEVEVWGQENAEAENRTGWVKGMGGDPLEFSMIWNFWTLPDLQVDVVPVQVLEEMSLIVHKATALKVFLRWEKKDEVFPLHQLDTVEVNDILLHWTALGGSQDDEASWKSGGLWLPRRTAESATRKREYREYDTASNSYDKFEKLASQDSVIFLGFMPLETGSYLFKADVILLDYHGKPQKFTMMKTLPAVVSRKFGMYTKAVAVGSNYTKTGTVNLSNSINASFSALNAIYPVPNVTRPANAGAIPWYKPTTSLWLFDWKVEPAWRFPKKYLLQEMSELCLKTSGCDAMVGYVPQPWLTDIGISLRESAPLGALVQMDTTENYRFVVAHEVGHLEGFDQHDTLPGGEGFSVLGSLKDRRYSVTQLPPRNQKTRNEIFNFMNQDPVESPPPERLWIAPLHYSLLLGRIKPASETEAGPAPDASEALSFTAQPELVSADQLLLASGGVTEPSGEVQPLPWYMLEPGAYPNPAPGPYKIMFLDGAGQELVSYTRSFTTTGTTDPAEPGLFTFKIPYPPSTARIQIRRSAGNTLLKEIVPSAAAPGLSLDPPASTTWQGEHTLTWQTSGTGSRYYAVDVSTDNGATWQAQAINLTLQAYTFDTGAFPNTSAAWVRIMATDGLRTSTASGGPYTFANPPQVSYVSPAPGELGAETDTQITAGFRDDMDPSSLTGATFTLSGGPFGSVPGVVQYDAQAHEAIFHPLAPLSYATQYTANLTTGIRNASGSALPAAVQWTFTTTARQLPPVPLAFSPAKGSRNVILNPVVSVIWDAPLDAATLTGATFTLSPVGGSPLSGGVGYDPATRTATFTPSADLLPGHAYIATLKAGIASTDGNATLGETRWVFTTGARRAGNLAFTSSFADTGRDENGDSLFESLVIRVGVQVNSAGVYHLAGRLVDALGAEIGASSVQASLPAGVSFVELAFSGAQIGGHGVDGPYTLTGLTLYQDGVPGGAIVLQQAHRTTAYTAAQFPAPLRFSGLPDLRLMPGASLAPAFNVRSYAHHITLGSDQLSYLFVRNSDPGAGVTLASDGSLNIQPQVGWTGSSQVSIQASDGQLFVQDSFQVTVGWASQLYLPSVVRNSSGPNQATGRDFWRIALKENFDDLSSTSSWRNGWGLLSNYPGYYWGQRDCAAYSGQYSGWAFGVSYLGPGNSLPCGANYPNSARQTMVTMPEMDPYHNKTVNLEFAAAAELRMKVLTNLDVGDQVCGLVAKDNAYKLEEYFGACRTGQTNGWEDLSLDLANVPNLGSLLGYKDLRVALDFRSNSSGSRPFGAYVDDLQVRVCLRGLPCQPAASPAPALVTGKVGGYTPPPYSGVTAAMGVESNGRIHVLWTGELPYFDEDYYKKSFVFYSTSTDGVHWTPAQAINDNGYTPRVAVDDTHHIVHLMYRGIDGLIHHTVTNGVVSRPNIIASAGGSANMAVDPITGYVHAVWLEMYPFYTGGATQYRARTRYAYWDGVSWSAPIPAVNNPDSAQSNLAVAPGAGVLLAWFQNWQVGSGGGVGPDDPRQVRTAYGPGLGDFPLRQAASGFYPVPENDESILLTYSGIDGKFYLVTDHFMWPGHSLVYRYTWKDGTWSAPLDVSGNTESFATPWHVGAAANQARVVYQYRVNFVNMLRAETNGVLGPAENLDTYLSGLGYEGNPSIYVDQAGVVHMVVVGKKNGDSGFYYLRK